MALSVKGGGALATPAAWCFCAASHGQAAASDVCAAAISCSTGSVMPTLGGFGLALATGPGPVPVAAFVRHGRGALAFKGPRIGQIERDRLEFYCVTDTAARWIKHRKPTEVLLETLL